LQRTSPLSTEAENEFESQSILSSVEKTVLANIANSTDSFSFQLFVSPLTGGWKAFRFFTLFAIHRRRTSSNTRSRPIDSSQPMASGKVLHPGIFRSGNACRDTAALNKTTKRLH